VRLHRGHSLPREHCGRNSKRLLPRELQKQVVELGAKHNEYPDNTRWSPSKDHLVVALLTTGWALGMIIRLWRQLTSVVDFYVMLNTSMLFSLVFALIWTSLMHNWMGMSFLTSLIAVLGTEYTFQYFKKGGSRELAVAPTHWTR
jgi:hypothetical protein